MDGIVSIATLQLQVPALADNQDNLWLSGAIDAVTAAIESPPVTGRWFVSRGPATYYFDAPASPDELDVPMGVSSLAYLGIAATDQPDDGSGTYTQITAGIYLDPPLQQRQTGEPASRITLGRLAARWFPECGARRAVKVTATWGWSSVPPRVAQIAATAVVRAYRAKQSGGADYAIVGPDGGMKVLRDFAPAELAELRATWRVPAVG